MASPFRFWQGSDPVSVVQVCRLPVDRLRVVDVCANPCFTKAGRNVVAGLETHNIQVEYVVVACRLAWEYQTG